jgi:hypothetical protein
VMLDRRWRTIRVIRVAPGRVLLPRPRVHHVLETTAGNGEALSRALGGRTIPDARRSARRE